MLIAELTKVRGIGMPFPAERLSHINLHNSLPLSADQHMVSMHAHMLCPHGSWQLHLNISIAEIGFMP